MPVFMGLQDFLRDKNALLENENGYKTESDSAKSKLTLRSFTQTASCCIVTI